MHTKAIVTIDTEPDNQWDLQLRKNLAFRNIAAIDKLQRIFDQLGLKPTYFVSYSVATCPAVSLLKDIKKSARCEIGAHLHAWETPPFQPALKGDGSYLHQYSLKIQEEKFKNLDSLLCDTFKDKPLSYRGGRYSFDAHAVTLLSKYGYCVDSSVTPGVSWEKDGGINFKDARRDDYLLQPEDKWLLEVPVTVRIRTKFKKAADFFYFNSPPWMHAQGFLRRLAGFRIIWLDPSFNEYEDMRFVCDTLLAQGSRYLNIMFHSSVIISGGSPYTPDEKSTSLFFERLRRLLDYLLKERKLQGLTIKEYSDYRKENINAG